MGSETINTFPSKGGALTESIPISKALCAPSTYLRYADTNACSARSNTSATPSCMGSPARRMVANTGCSANRFTVALPNGVSTDVGLNARDLLTSTAMALPNRFRLNRKRNGSCWMLASRSSATNSLVMLSVEARLVTMGMSLTNAFKYLFVHRTPPLPFIALTDCFIVPQQGEHTVHILHRLR